MAVMVVMGGVWLLWLIRRLLACGASNRRDFIEQLMVRMAGVSGSMVRRGKTWS